MSGLLNIGITGLNAAQAGLTTTGHNITNAGTPGYNRQFVQQGTNDPLFTGVGFFGRGTRIETISRSFNQFLENQVLAADNRRAEFSTYNAQISQINNLLADPDAGLAPALQGFFAGVQEVAANPSSVAARQAMLSSAQALASRFQAMDMRISEVRQGVESELAVTVDLINSYAVQIADLNQRLLVAQSAGTAVPANDLLDQRNLLVAELNQLVKVSTVTENDGSLNVFIGSGQALVLGQQVSTLGTRPSQDDPTRLAVSLIGPTGKAIELPENIVTGGRIGGLLAFRREALDPAQNQLGLIALGMAEAFNAQHRLGVDLEGVLGADFFRSPPVTVRPANAATVTTDPAEIGRLTASDYRLTNDGGGLYTLVRLSDGVRLLDNEAPAGGFPIQADGLRIDPAALAVGEAALIQPTRFAARDIAVALTDPRRIAAGSPVSSSVPATNGGDARVAAITVTDTAGMTSAGSRVPDFGQIRLVFDAAAGQFNVTAGGVTPASLPFDPMADASGREFTLQSPDGFSFRVTLAGAPQDGDAVLFAPNAGGVADNRNATLLGALQSTKVLGAGADGEPTAALTSVYAQLVSSVGNKTREVQVGERAQESVLRQAKDARDALSGVNLDEEAANLLRYQQAYQAAGRVMSIAQRLFDEVLSIAR